jgi:hypothetical protein
MRKNSSHPSELEQQAGELVDNRWNERQIGDAESQVQPNSHRR